MAKMFQVYGVGQALIPCLPPPIAFQNAPTSNQSDYEIGQIAYTPPGVALYFYIYAGAGIWLPLLGGGGGGALDTLSGNTGGTVSPTSFGNISLIGYGNILLLGTTNTITAELTGLVNHNVLLGAGTSTITNVPPTASSGVPFISNGLVSDPSFGTATVAGGGTGATSFTPYSVICAGTTSTGAFQDVSGVGTAGQVLTSNGAGALPTWQVGSSSTGIQTITGNTGGAISPTLGNVDIVGSGSIAVTGAGSTLTITNSGSGGVTWSDVGSSSVVAVGTGSFSTAAITLTLPPSPFQGNLVSFIVDNAGALTIQANSGQIIRLGQYASSTSGTATSNALGDSLSLVYRAADNSWIAYAAIGNWTLI